MPTLTAKGWDGSVTFDGAAVTIRRSGYVARRLHHGGGQTVIPLSQVSAVEFKSLGLNPGRFTIVTGGGIQRPGGRAAHANDPLSVEFMLHGKDFATIRDAITQALASSGSTFRANADGSD